MDIDAVKKKSLARYKQERDWFALCLEGAKLIGTPEGRPSDISFQVWPSSSE